QRQIVNRLETLVLLEETKYVIAEIADYSALRSRSQEAIDCRKWVLILHSKNRPRPPSQNRIPSLIPIGSRGIQESKILFVMKRGRDLVRRAIHSGLIR